MGCTRQARVLFRLFAFIGPSPCYDESNKCGYDCNPQEQCSPGKCHCTISKSCNSKAKQGHRE